jgi:hypothetical protein
VLGGEDKDEDPLAHFFKDLNIYKENISKKKFNNKFIYFY